MKGDHPHIAFFGCTEPGGPVQFHGSDTAGNRWTLTVPQGKITYKVARGKRTGTGPTAAAAWGKVVG